ncbi:protein chibby homolog 1-like [Nelusetta ayraudi]|uniref:protein chibby homolog 1-like n=1 Tax=Nelusetta ayraudi TaxID=303726 RepID=UPI003F6FAA76
MTFNFKMAHPKLLRYYDTIMSVKLKKKRVTLPKIGDMFSPKKAPPRRSATLSSLHTLDRSAREFELGLEYGPPVLNINGQSWIFEDGQWMIQSKGNSLELWRNFQRLKKKYEQVKEENNFLKLKYELLMEVCTEKANELEEKKRQHPKRR